MKNFFLLLFLVFLNSCRNSSNPESTTSDSYSTVINRKTINVGYTSYPPGFEKDPKTGKFTGIFHEVLEEIGKSADLKINYVEEVGWGTMIEALKSGRVDMIASPVWPTTQRAVNCTFSSPIFWSGIGAYVLQNSSLTLDKINSQNVKIAVMDGELNQAIAKVQYPLAVTTALTQNSDISQLLLEIANKKADVTFIEPLFADNYIKNNPGVLKNIASSKPVRIYPNAFMFLNDNIKLKNLIDVSIQELHNNGFIENIIKKYEPEPNVIYRNAEFYTTNR